MSIPWRRAVSNWRLGRPHCDRSRLARVAGRPDPCGRLLLARPAVGSDVNACPGRPSPGNSFFGHGHRVYLDPLWGRPGEMIRPYLIARKGQVLISSQFDNESTVLSAGCPVSPGRKAGRGVPPGRGIYQQRRGFADRFDRFRDRMAAPGGLLLRLWPRLPRGKSFNHRCDYFSGACGIWIDHPTARVGGGVQVSLGRVRTRAVQYGPRDGHHVRLSRIV